ncbi:MAG: hypothetical protein U1E39_13265 [Planctomycetota bacterium]
MPSDAPGDRVALAAELAARAAVLPPADPAREALAAAAAALLAPVPAAAVVPMRRVGP